MRLGGIILGTSYLLGMSWYIFSDIEQSHPDTFLDSTGEMFYTEYGLGERSKLEVCSGMIYYAFTTLSTVGFGDFHPKNNTERALTSMILLFGVIVFSYLTGNFLELVNGYQVLLWENEDGENLSRFFGLLAKYNNGQPLKRVFIDEIESYFEFYWAHDKQASLALESDLRFFDELPREIQQEIFKNFLF